MRTIVILCVFGKTRQTSKYNFKFYWGFDNDKKKVQSFTASNKSFMNLLSQVILLNK